MFNPSSMRRLGTSLMVKDLKEVVEGWLDARYNDPVDRSEERHELLHSALGIMQRCQSFIEAQKEPLSFDEESLIGAGCFITAIKLYKDRTGCGLAFAKDVVLEHKNSIKD